MNPGCCEKLPVVNITRLVGHRVIQRALARILAWLIVRNAACWHKKPIGAPQACEDTHSLHLRF